MGEVVHSTGGLPNCTESGSCINLQRTSSDKGVNSLHSLFQRSTNQKHTFARYMFSINKIFHSVTWHFYRRLARLLYKHRAYVAYKSSLFTCKHYNTWIACTHTSVIANSRYHLCTLNTSDNVVEIYRMHAEILIPYMHIML